MLSASTPAALPRSASPPKRSAPHDDQRPRPKPRVNGGFLIEDDDSEDEDGSQDHAHAAKKRMLHHPGAVDLPVDSAEATPPDIDGDASANDVDTNSGANVPLPPSQSFFSLLSNGQALLPSSVLNSINPTAYSARSHNGKTATVKQRKATASISYESIVAARSRTKEGRAKRSYYGIDIHELIDSASKELSSTQQPKPTEPNVPVRSVEQPSVQ